MQRVSAPYTVTLPTGKTGFQNANPPAVPQGTQLPDTWFNDVQENICAVIEGTGIALEDSDSIGGAGQLAQGIRRLTASNYTYMPSTVYGFVTLTADMSGRIYADATSANQGFTLPPANAADGTIAGVVSDNSLEFEIFRSDQSTVNTLWIEAPTGNSLIFAGGSLGAGVPLYVPSLYTVRLWSDSNASWIAELRPPAPAVPHVYDYTSAGTYTVTVPLGVTRMLVRRCIGGGGGGGGAGSNGGAVGGGAGGAASCVLPVAPGQTVTVTVGAGGVGGAGGSTPAAGGAGGTSEVSVSASVFASATGGQGGASAAANVMATTANGGGFGTVDGVQSGDSQSIGIWIGGGGSFPLGFVSSAIYTGSAITLNGMGAAPEGAAQPVFYNQASPAPPAIPGAGGMGALNGGTGAAGAAGRVTIEM